MANLPYTRRSGHLAAAFLVASSVLLAACGGGDDTAEADADSAVAAETVTETTTTTTTTTAPPTTIATTSTVAPELTGFPEFTTDSNVTTAGIDSVLFGQTVAQAGTAADGEFVPVDGSEGPCFLVRPSGGPLGVQLTVTEGTIERVDITTPDITTRSGAGVGMTEQELADLFGASLTTQPSETGGNQVVFTPSDEGDAQFRVIFETNGEEVLSFRSGRVLQVLPTIPCSEL